MLACSRALRTLFVQTQRSASTTSNPFPFPTNSNPTPYQIFHLSTDASEREIRARYVDLVKIYHPDKVGRSTCQEVAHARFQSITAAYDILRKKTCQRSMASPSSSSEDQRAAAAARYVRLKTEKLYSGRDDGWKDRIILAGVVGTIILFIGQTFITRKQALAESVARTRSSNTSTLKAKETPIVASTLPSDHADRRLSG